MGWWPDFFDETVFLGSSLGRWTIALAVAGASFFVLRLALGILRARIRTLSQRTATKIDDLIADLLDRTKTWLLLVLALYLGSLVLVLDGRSLAVVRALVSVSLVLQGGLWGSVVLVFLTKTYVERHVDRDAAAATSVAALGFLAKFVLWALVLVLMLQNLGIDVTPLVAGIGVGGIAIALASQHILGDLFASFVILLDKPFVIGDFIVVGDFQGIVEYVGLKTTRVRSLSGEQVVFANTDLLNSRVRNFKRMFERRNVLSVGVTYETPLELLEQIPGIVRDLVEAQPKTRFDRAHLVSFGDSALVFEAVYFVLSPDFNTHADIRQAIHLGILRRFQELGIVIAYPTQVVHLADGASLAVSGAPAAPGEPGAGGLDPARAHEPT